MTTHRRTSVEALVDGGRCEHVHSLGRERVALSPLSFGAVFFEHMATRDVPSGDWRQASYLSSAPALFVLHDVLVHSSAGLLAVDGAVMAETLAHADPGEHGFTTTADGIVFDEAAVETVDEVCITLLAGGCSSLYHWLIESVGRLGVVPPNYRMAADMLLVPQEAGAVQLGLLGRLGLPDGLRTRSVRRRETLRVRTLIVPLAFSAALDLHPCLHTPFQSVPAQAAIDAPRRLYIDRRGSAARRLLNEDALVERLGEHGIVAVQLEALGLEAQIALFRQAELIVSPHGAGLANLVYANAGCMVLELQMDGYVNWCFRRLAGVLGLDYDCIVGRANAPWPPLSADVHALSWQVSVPHVLAALPAAPGRHKPRQG